MNDKRLRSIQLLENVFIFIVLYTIIIIPLALYADNVNETVFKTLALMLVIFAQSLIRGTIKNFFAFLFLHLAFIWLCFLFGNGLVEKIGYILFGVLSTIVSYRLHFADPREAFQISLLIVSEALITFCYILAGYFNIPLLPNVLHVMSILFFITFMLYYHGTNMAVSLNNLANIKNQPIKQILSFNNKVIVLFLALMLIFLLSAPFFHIGDLIKLFGSLFLFIIRFLFSLLGSSEPPAPYVEQSAPIQQDPTLGMLIQDVKEPSIIAQVIEKIFIYAFSIAIIAGIVLLIGLAIYTFYKRFYSAGKKSEVDETKEFIGLIDIFNENPLTGLLKRILPNGLGSTNEQKIRRLFYRKVKKQIAKGTEVEISETASEISEKIKPHENLTNLTPLYEKARYSNIPCTKEDINLANQTLKK